MATVTTESLVSARFRLLVVILHFVLIPPLTAISEPGKWVLDVDFVDGSPKFYYFPKTMFNNTVIDVKLNTAEHAVPVNLTIEWYLRSSPCYDEVFGLDLDSAKYYFRSDTVIREGSYGFYIYHKPTTYESSNLALKLGGKGFDHFEPLKPLHAETTTNPQSRRKRDAVKTDEQTKNVAATHAPNAPKSKDSSSVETSPFAVAQTWEDSPYMFIIKIEANPPPAEDIKSSIKLEVRMHGDYQYISASEWPLMIFYMVMCIIYVFMGVLWLALSACYWRELLRIQFWIGGVVFLGMLEKAVYYAEFQSIRYDGLSVQGAVVFAEVLSAVKRTLARVLVIIASLGYGIVKPRLGALLHRVVGVGLLYLIFSIIEGVLRVNTENGGSSRLLCDIVMALIDSCIVWWISFHKSIIC